MISGEGKNGGTLYPASNDDDDNDDGVSNNGCDDDSSSGHKKNRKKHRKSRQHGCKSIEAIRRRNSFNRQINGFHPNIRRHPGGL